MASRQYDEYTEDLQKLDKNRYETIRDKLFKDFEEKYNLKPKLVKPKKSSKKDE
jgi:hypothetical protein